MSNRRLILFLVGLGFLLGASPGCLTTPRSPPVPVPVLVVDAETRAPVAGAAVRLWCPDPRAPGLGKDASGTTGPDGIARVQSAAKEDVGVVLGVTAAGYLAEQKDFRGNGTAHDGTPPGVMQVELFAGPRPTVEFVVPNGFRGVIKAEVRVEDPPAQPGRRAFSFPVGSDGTVQVVGSRVLGLGPGPDYRARYADGAPLTLNPEGLVIGFRWLGYRGDTQFFVVGTHADWNEAHREFVKDDPPSRGTAAAGQGRAGGGGRGGRGGGGHRGGGGGGGNGSGW